jgi:hypothetical protein
MGHRWDRSARRIEKLRVRLQWRANGTVPIKPRGMHERTFQHTLGMLAYHEAIRKQGTSYARKERPDQHRAHLWRQCRSRFAVPCSVDGRSADLQRAAWGQTATSMPREPLETFTRWVGFDE